MKIYYANVMDLDVDWALTQVPEFRREKALALRAMEARKCSLGAWLLLQKAVGMPVPAVEYTPDGKPFFPGAGAVEFNLTHGGVYAACVVADMPVGIDIQRIGAIRPGVLARFYSEEERALVGQSEYEFTRLWAMKESYVKACGEGLRRKADLSLVQGWEFRTWQIEDYVLAVCAREKITEPERMELTHDDD
ncbi:MAG: 4'-phosphopantetheinyl transferase superfamily protein [Firmicutes bacterium]|nr:4'-phosphopantetheinyl transferase superfamily protein [Bacillota bacterium]